MENPNVEIVYHAFESKELIELVQKVDYELNSEDGVKAHTALQVRLSSLLNFLKFAA
jgi:hypothetical protein